MSDARPTLSRPMMVSMNAQGRIVIPADVRNAMGWRSGEKLAIRIDLESGDVRLNTPRAQWNAVREELAHLRAKPGDRRASDELIAERRIEAVLEAIDDLAERRRVRRALNS